MIPVNTSTKLLLFMATNMERMKTKMTDKDWIQTYTGKKVYPLGPFSPEDVDILDIAHALAHTCRWGGHCSQYYSVAEHSILVSHRIEERFALEGLLHDGAEAYIGDIPTPIKEQLPAITRAEHRIMSAIREKFDLAIEWPEEELHKADWGVQGGEVLQMMPDVKMFKESRWQEEYDKACYKGTFRHLGPRAAEILFLRRFEELQSP